MHPAKTEASPSAAFIASILNVVAGPAWCPSHALLLLWLDAILSIVNSQGAHAFKGQESAKRACRRHKCLFHPLPDAARKELP
jgi:hypothetical protein